MDDTSTTPDDPGRDPVGLDPPRDVLDATAGVPDEGSSTPGRSTDAEPQTSLDQPPGDPEDPDPTPEP